MVRKSSASIVPNGSDQNVYLVVDDFGRWGHANRETNVEEANLASVITNVMSGQFNGPIRVVRNTVERWSEVISEHLAREIKRRCELVDEELLSAFVESYIAARQPTPRLAP
jgi:hypothetical protein